MNNEEWKAVLWVCKILYGIDEQTVRAELWDALGKTPSEIQKGEAVRTLSAVHKGKLEEIQKHLKERGLQ